MQFLPGGLTNTNLKVTTVGGDFVVRVSTSDVGLLDIDRDHEYRNSETAYRSGVGAEVVSYRPDLGALVIRFLSGESLSNENFDAPGRVQRAARAVRKLHDGEKFLGEFDMFLRQARSFDAVRARGFRHPADYADCQDHWRAIEAVLSKEGWRDGAQAVACNNDLLAANFLDDGTVCRLIDYEYSGNNDPSFELGNTATECDFTPEMTEAYVEEYLAAGGEAMSARFLARVRIQMLVSAYGWAPWGFIQAATSSMDYDFYGWGLERFEKAKAGFSGPGFERLLQEVAQ